MAVQDRLYTADDLWEIAHLPENDDKRFELINGVIYELPPSSPANTIVAGLFVHKFNLYLEQHDLGYVTGADGGFIISGQENVFMPDAAFISYARVPEFPKKLFPAAPDIAVEVISPSETPRKIRNKVNAYLRGGTRLVWVVYPEDKAIDVYQLAPDGGTHIREFTIEDTLDGGDVLPGFTLPVREIFKKLRD